MKNKRLIGLFLLWSVVILTVLSSCNDDDDDESEPVNNNVIKISITDPQSDKINKGQVVSILALVEATLINVELAEVRFFVDGIEIGLSQKSPYQYSWDTSNVENGWHTLKVEVKASDGTIGMDEKKILLEGNVTKADAGNDIIVNNGSISLTLSANKPKYDYETGYWTIEEQNSGEGGSFSDLNKADALFTGKLNTEYTLRWNISNDFQSNYDEVRISFKKLEYGSVTDIDGNTYKTVIIGNQEWMTENLKVTHFPDGSAIPYVTNSKEWGLLKNNNTDAAYCYYNNTSSKYGALYTYAAAKKACPSGWHLATYVEWEKLKDYVGKTGNFGRIGTALTSSKGWKDYPGLVGDNRSDIYGFSALPGGYRMVSNRNSRFESVGETTSWWLETETEIGNGKASSISIFYNRDLLFLLDANKHQGFSVRCVKN